MQDSSTYQIQKNIAILAVGEPGVGKTRLSMAFPAPWFLDLDLKLSSAAGVANGKKFWFSQVAQIEPAKRYAACETEIKAAIAHKEVETLVIDGVTMMAQIVKDSIIGELEKMGLGTKMRQDVVEPQIRLTDYDTLATRFLRLVALTRASNKFVVWTSHQKVEKDEMSGANRYRIHMPGNLAENLGGYFTDVWAMTAAPAFVGGKPITKYAIRTKPTGQHVNLSASIPLEPEIDITDKTPEQVWAILGPKLNYKKPTP